MEARFKNKRTDLTGEVFSRLTVLSKDGRLWTCVCQCGAGARVSARNLLNGITRSCGCLRKERTKTIRSWAERSAKIDHPFHALIWKAHKLQLTDSWRDSFVQFVSDVGPVNGKLERIDSSKPFSPNNFRWISTTQLFWQGEWKALHAICKQENVRYKNVHQFCKRGRSLIESIRYAKQRKLTA